MIEGPAIADGDRHGGIIGRGREQERLRADLVGAGVGKFVVEFKASLPWLIG